MLQFGPVNLGYTSAVISSYLLGSIPTGYVVGLAKGVDIRKVGSGNIGATNVFRSLGQRLGIFVLVADGLKGWAACELISNLVLRNFYAESINDLPFAEYLKMTCGVCVILGHNYTFWLRFKGGKGIATTAGVLAALFWPVFITVLSTWIVFFLATRYVSIGSIAAAISLPIAAIIFNNSHRLIFVASILGALALWKHLPNFKRLLQGTENRISFRKKPDPEVAK